jgi:PAS domain S-box-containing protein
MKSNDPNPDRSTNRFANPGKPEQVDVAVSPAYADHLSDALIFTDADFRILSINKAGYFLYGLEERDFISEPLPAIINYDYYPESFQHIRNVLEGSGHWKGNVSCSIAEERIIDVTLSIVKNMEGENEQGGFLFISHPAVRKDKHRVLPTEMEAIKVVYDDLPEGIIVKTIQGEIIYGNAAALNMMGLTIDQLQDKRNINRHCRFIDENRLSVPADILLGADYEGKESRDRQNIITGIYRPDNLLVWVKMYSALVSNPLFGQQEMVITSFIDITRIMTAEEHIRSSEKKWISILDNNRIGIFLVDEKNNLLLINEEGKRLLRLLFNVESPGINTSLIDLLTEDRKKAVQDMLTRAIQGGRVEYEIVYHREDEDIWLLLNYSPVKTPDGAVNSVCITSTNITHLKKNESELIQSEQRWKFALDGAGDGVWEYNFQTKESYYSPLYKTMLGFAEDEFKNEAFEWQTRLHPEDISMIRDIDVAYETGAIENHSVEYRLKSKSGDYVWVLDRGMLLSRSPDGRPLTLIGTHKNITERKLSEERLFKSQHLFSSFMANTPTMTWIIDEHNIFRYLNASYLDSFGLSRNAIGKSIYDIFPKSICDVFVENNWKVWNSRSSIETVEEGLGPDGSYQLYHIFKFPLDDENGTRLLGGVALDITQKSLLEKKLADEQEKKKREIIQAIINAQEDERHELASELHDNVNQILSSTKLMLEIAVERPESGKEFTIKGLHYLQEAMQEIRRISHNLIPGTLKDISLEAAIDEVIQNINATNKLKINYSKEFNGMEEKIGAGVQLSILRIIQEQFNNILKHADASEATFSLVADEKMIYLSIGDNGRGFDTMNTKKGIGLSGIFNRVEFFHGLVELNSLPGSGCSLHIEIPIKLPI